MLHANPTAAADVTSASIATRMPHGAADAAYLGEAAITSSGSANRSPEAVPEADAKRIAACCLRLHARLIGTDLLFHPSWECAPPRLQDRLRWADRLFEAGAGQLRRRPLFEHVIERLILLGPADLQRLLCAMSLLARREDLRRCIDGPAVRALQAVVGTPALAAILRAGRLPQAGAVGADLSVTLLVAQGYARLVQAYAGEWTMVLQCLRLALPVDLPSVACTDSEEQVDNLLRQAHA